MQFSILSKARAAIDALQLIWPITGGYRLVIDGLVYRTWPRISRLARLYRRWIIPKTCIIAVVGSLGKTPASGRNHGHRRRFQVAA